MSPNSSAISPDTHSFLKEHFKDNEYQVLALAGDASSRRYFRIVHKNISYVLMVWQPFKDDGRFPFLNVRDHFEKHSIDVPKVLAKSPGQGLILLEDLGDLTLERKFWENQNHSLALPFYKRSIDAILKVHYPASKDVASGCVAFDVDFNVDKLLWEMDYGLRHFIEGLCKVQLSLDQRDSLTSDFKAICTELHNQPKHICHRDYHSRNIMLPMGKVVLIDFQDARMGPVQYDLVSLLHDSYVALKGDMRGQLLDYYLDQAKQYGAEYDRDQFLRIFDIQKLQRCFKACGSFASFFNTREDTRYLKYLHKTMQRVRKTLNNFPEYKNFAAVIDDNKLLERHFVRNTTLQDN